MKASPVSVEGGSLLLWGQLTGAQVPSPTVCGGERRGRRALHCCPGPPADPPYLQDWREPVSSERLQHQQGLRLCICPQPIRNHLEFYS